MEITVQNIVFIILILFTGLSAGLCFTWSNTVTTGISRLDDFGYLSAFQQMNRTILNPTFFVVFFGPVFINLINLYFFKSASNNIIWLLVIATILYVFGVALVTIFGNVPLNEILNNTELTSASEGALKDLRAGFENKWNQLHHIRTLSSSMSFLLLLMTILIKK
ncbi:anthrone oxygenase family protein [Changchengzhania lutea]|uniref:anthrone oxygenase family protein n=1 Tax=Changchengzhania lutea TaxID=2049305 RepID=UPI00115E9C5C|nr:DUF1772 domain-containing protein [Changchengzhania lutea]